MSLRLKHLRQLMHTTAMRLALRYAVFQILVLAIALATLFWVVNRYVSEQIAVSLSAELAALKTLPPDTLANRINVLTLSRGPARGSRYYLLLDPHGSRRAGDIRFWPAWLKPDGALGAGNITVPDRDSDSGALNRVEASQLFALGAALPGGGHLLIAQEPGATEDLREDVLIAALGVLALTASLAIVLGLSLGWQWLKRVEAINRTAGRIAAGDLSQRVDTSRTGDEFDLLASHLNAMLSRIELAVAGMREVSDNVAHDLRRPLARLKTRIDVLLAQPRTADDYREALVRTAADADELIRTFDALLSIARLEAGSEIETPDGFDLAACVRKIAELYEDDAEDVARPFSLDLPDTVPARGEPALIARAVANLLDNAFKYTDAGTAVKIKLVSSAERVSLDVIDYGKGLGDGEHTRMTERFTRADTARTQPGSGLGLALVKAIMHAHGGALVLVETPGGGLTARLEFPPDPAA